MATMEKDTDGKKSAETMDHMARTRMTTKMWRALREEAYFTETSVSEIIRTMVAKRQRAFRVKSPPPPTGIPKA